MPTLINHSRRVHAQPVGMDSTPTTVELAPPSVVTVRLAGAPEAPLPRRTVQWTEDTVDNEELGRKKSKSELLCGMLVESLAQRHTHPTPHHVPR
jgi:hypothetical protein